MELWIRSQDKESLIKCNNYINYFYDDIEQTYGIGSHGYNLGEYKTKERAIEVLDEIQRLLEKDKFEEDRYCCDKLTKAIVYEMPKE